MSESPQRNTTVKSSSTAEQRRLQSIRKRHSNWKLWGPYLSERGWGTVREDYSPDGKTWSHFTHDQARHRAYRWNEDGLAGFSDDQQYLCFSLALWNGQDPFLKERLFGLAGPEGNHGEDVKELYWYTDSTPTHSFCEMCYRYPQGAFPYQDLININAQRGYDDSEFELTDTGIFNENRFFDVTVRYAKAAGDDLLIEIDVFNAGPDTASLALVPQLWFRNTWSWGYPQGPRNDVAALPQLQQQSEHCIIAEHPVLGRYHWYWQGVAATLFTDNNSAGHNEQAHNKNAVSDAAEHSNDDENEPPQQPSVERAAYTRDAFHRAVVQGESDAVNPARQGTKAGLHYTVTVASQGHQRIRLRLSANEHDKPFERFGSVLNRRRREADAFYDALQDPHLSDEKALLQRQALAGMLWSKQLFYYDVEQWYHGDPQARLHRSEPRNSHWHHLKACDILSMPDTWEYPWFAVWDTAFHCLPLAMVDVDFAKQQLLLMTLDRYQHPNGQLPAYEYAFDDVNPPVHAWGVLSVCRLQQQEEDVIDLVFLETAFHKLLLNYTWWLNRKDPQNRAIFTGGFLGLDNISVFDRSLEPPGGGELDQSDATAWMGFFALCMMQIALELARSNSNYESLAIRFLDHHQRIADALHGSARHPGLWDTQDGFYYDSLRQNNGEHEPLRVRSLTGLLPLIATHALQADAFNHLPAFRHRLTQYQQTRATSGQAPAGMSKVLLAFVEPEQLTSVLRYMLDESEFLSPHGIRSLSKYHAQHPVQWSVDGQATLTAGYEPAEGQSDLFGGNSNWRGPVWFPMNYLLIEGLREYNQHFGNTLTIEYPTGSDQYLSTGEIADRLSDRLISLFTVEGEQPAPWCGDDAMLASTRAQNRHLFYEYFNGDTGAGLGASHQTGWTGLIALLLQHRAACG